MSHKPKPKLNKILSMPRYVEIKQRMQKSAGVKRDQINLELPLWCIDFHGVSWLKFCQ